MKKQQCINEVQHSIISLEEEENFRGRETNCYYSPTTFIWMNMIEKKK